MRLLTVTNEQGITLLEVIIVTLIIGVLAAIGIPSLAGMMRMQNVKEGLVQVQSGLQDAQRQAIRKSQNCSIAFGEKVKDDQVYSYFFVPDKDDTSQPTTDEKEKHCLVASSYDTTLPKNVELKHNLPKKDNTGYIKFNYKGYPSYDSEDEDNDVPTIVIYSTEDPTHRKCILMPGVLGIFITGNYQDTSSTIGDPKSDKCKPDETSY